MGLDKFGVSRTYRKAVNMVVEDFKNNGFDSNYTFYISHAFNEELAMMFEKKIFHFQIAVSHVTKDLKILLFDAL